MKFNIRLQSITSRNLVYQVWMLERKQHRCQPLWTDSESLRHQRLKQNQRNYRRLSQARKAPRFWRELSSWRRIRNSFRNLTSCLRLRWSERPDPSCTKRPKAQKLMILLWSPKPPGSSTTLCSEKKSPGSLKREFQTSLWKGKTLTPSLKNG